MAEVQQQAISLRSWVRYYAQYSLGQSVHRRAWRSKIAFTGCDPTMGVNEGRMAFRQAFAEGERHAKGLLLGD